METARCPSLLTAGGGNRALPSFVLRRDSWPGAQVTTTGTLTIAALEKRPAGLLGTGGA